MGSDGVIMNPVTSNIYTVTIECSPSGEKVII